MKKLLIPFLATAIVLLSGVTRANPLVISKKQAQALPFKINFTISDNKGKLITDKELKNKISLDISSKRSNSNVTTISYKLTSLKNESQFFKITCSLILPQSKYNFFDGKKQKNFANRLFNIKNIDMLSGGTFPLAAIWNQTGGVALTPGAKDLHSSLKLFVLSAKNKVVISEVLNIALLKKDSVYKGKFHIINFNSKYMERDALANYYVLYPELFKKNKDIDPKINGVSAGYYSWTYSDPEYCRFAGADWDWCIRPSRRSGDVDDSHYKYKPVRSMKLNKTCKYRDRKGKWHKVKAARKNRQEWLAIQNYRLDTADYCNVSNALYTCGLSVAEEKLAKQCPDSLPGPHSSGVIIEPGPAPQDDSMSVFTFKETAWGQMIRKMIKNVAQRNIKAMAFDIPRGNQQYRGTALGKMQNVSWDKFGPFVVRAVANAKLYDFVRTINNDKYKLGVINNVNQVKNIYDCFFTNTTMVESNPWHFAPPWPLHLRYAMGEKAVSWWEGYHLEEFDPNFRNKPKEEIEQYVRGLANYCAQRTFELGITYPAHFSCSSEYLQKMLPAVKLCNRANWKIIPGAKAVSSQTSTARYGCGINTIISIQNLKREERTVKVEIFADELWSDTLTDKKRKKLLFAGFYGLPVINSYADGKQFVELKILPHKPRIIESVAILDRAANGKISAKWDTKLEKAVLTITANAHNGKLRLREKFGPYRLQGNSKIITLNGKSEAQVVYRNINSGITAKQLAEYKFLAKNSASPLTIYHSGSKRSKIMAERLSIFFKSAASHLKKQCKIEIQYSKQLQENSVALTNKKGALNNLSSKMFADHPYISGTPEKGLLIISASSPENLSKAVTEFCNAVNRINFPSYTLHTKMLPEEKKMFNSWRYSY